MSDTAIEENEQNSAQDSGKSARQILLEEIGHKLTASREARGEALEQPVRILKLRKRHVQALESGNWDGMPDDVYVLGFLRQYSQYLNVDLNAEIERLKNDEYALTKPMTFPDPPVAPSRHWAWIFGIAFVLLFIIFNLVSQNDILENSGTTGVASTAGSSPDPEATGSSKAADDSVSTPAASMPDSTTTDPAADSMTSSQPNVISPEMQPVDNTKPAATPGSTAHAPQPASDTVSTVKSAAQQRAVHLYRFEAVGSPVWLQISLPNKRGSGKGKRLKEVLLKPGHHLNIRNRSETLWITCGNAPALQISADHRIVAAQGSLGNGRKVLRDYRFSIAGKQ